jgi:hypothetical protein
MNWTLVALLSGCGVAMGVASVLGFTTGIEEWLWLAVGVISVAVLLRRRPLTLPLHAFLVGLVGGGLAPVGGTVCGRELGLPRRLSPSAVQVGYRKAVDARRSVAANHAVRKGSV